MAKEIEKSMNIAIEKELQHDFGKDAPKKEAPEKAVEKQPEKTKPEIEKVKSIDAVIDKAGTRLALKKLEKAMNDGDRERIERGGNVLEIERSDGKLKYKLNGKETNEKEMLAILEKTKTQEIKSPLKDLTQEIEEKQEEIKREKEWDRMAKIFEHTARRDSYRGIEVSENTHGDGRGSEKYDDLREREEAAISLDR